MKNNYIIPLLLILLFSTSKVFAYDHYNEDGLQASEVFQMILLGGGILLVGYLLGQAKILAGIARVIAVIGAIIGGLGLVGLALIILAWAAQAAFYLAIAVGFFVVVGYILYAFITGYLLLENKMNHGNTLQRSKLQPGRTHPANRFRCDRPARYSAAICLARYKGERSV